MNTGFLATLYRYKKLSGKEINLKGIKQDLIISLEWLLTLYVDLREIKLKKHLL